MRRVFVIALGVALSVSGSAWAQKCDSEPAKKAARDGKSKYDRGDYAKAIELFEKAYDECPSTWLLFNLGQAHRMLGNNEQAITFYRSWLRESPDADPAVRKEVEARIVELAGIVAAQRQTAEKPPTGATVDAPPERDAQEPAPVVEAPSAPPSEPLERPPWYSDRWAWVFAGAGVAVAVTGGAFLLSAEGLEDDAASAGDERSAASLYDESDGHRTTATVLLIGGGALVATGVVLFAINPAPERSVRATFDVRPGGGMLVVGGSF